MGRANQFYIFYGIKAIKKIKIQELLLHKMRILVSWVGN